MRPAVLDDAALAADLMTAAYPPEPVDPILTRYRWKHPHDGWLYGRYIAEVDGTPIALVIWSHGRWDLMPEGHCDHEVYLELSRLDPDLMAWLVEWVAARAVEEGARILLAYTAEDESIYRAVLERLGYEPDRADRVWELDLRLHGERLIAEARAAREKVESTGVALTTLASWPDAAKMRKLHELAELTRQDIPHTIPILPQSFENFVERMSTPDVHMDRLWIGVDEDRLVAWSYLRFPPVRGAVWTGYTCCHPDYRGRGLARAVKLQSVAQAARLGVPAIRAANDTENAPMLHINEALGYTSRPGFIGHRKRVQT
jgi:RimJ/RimL family protein N-acetyltransferase